MRDFIVKIFVKIGLYKWTVCQINQVKFMIQSRRMKKHGIEMLKQADQVFTEAGVKAFLTFGCLLGAHREHGFISYDPDIDLGIMADEVPEDLHQRLAKAGFILCRQFVLGKKGKILEESYMYNNLQLDIFYYFKEGNDLYCYCSGKHESKDWKEANATDGFPCYRSYVPQTDFERRDFLGVPVYMPVKTHEWLTDIYSDSYMTPIKNWTSVNGEYVTRIIKTEERSYRELC